MNALPQTIRFTATDVTGTHSVEATDVQRNLPAGAVASALADRLGLPKDVPWALRSDTTSAHLDEDVAMGEQIETAANVTLFPRTHLGGRPRGDG